MNEIEKKSPESISEKEGLSTGRVVRIFAAAGVLFVALYLFGFYPRLTLHRQLLADATAESQRLPVVNTTRPKQAPELLDVPLPGNIQPILETSIFARTNGYLKARYVDIGDPVSKGQLLADIASPEVDEQLRQAVATLSQSKADLMRFEADLTLARTTLQRYLTAGAGTVSKQLIDEKTAAAATSEKAVESARATVEANQANVKRLRETQGFEKVYAPFAGVITVRNVDPGALISAGSGSGVTELFRLSKVDILRVFVYVPQSYAPDLRVGQAAEVSVREMPQHIFQGKVVRTAGAIDSLSRTMLAEAHVPNPERRLLAGSYATVRFKIARANPPLVVPSNALLIDAQGVRVALVDGSGALSYRAIQIGRDYGDQVEVLSGVDLHDVIATGLPGGIVAGSRVEIAKPKNGSLAPSNPTPATAPPAQSAAIK